ncbi:MAG: GNAT family N-acetyltransferase [Gammaproteobacteria bacterium]|nr:GNAT family N-acetyltransferase [Gammaproteobacteria bacterium]
MKILETERFILRVPTLRDAPLILELFNQPDCVQYMGDKNLKTVEDAEKFLEDRFLSMYKKYGFCLFIIQLVSLKVSAGICGLVKRDSMDDVEVGYAILSAYQNQGIALETGLAVRDYAFNVLGLKRLAGLTAVDNYGSAHVLERIGLNYIKNIQLEEFNGDTKYYLRVAQ